MFFKTINIRGELLLFDRPKVMGVLNATPDSFYNQGRKSDLISLLHEAEAMLGEGAEFLDIGGMSTNPHSKIISPEEEWLRLKPVIKELRKAFPKAYLSVDTYRASIAQKAADLGIDLINDISAGEMDRDMLDTVAQLKLPFIAMHMQGTPQTMQKNPFYDDVARDIFDYFIKKLGQIEAAGIKDVIVDPGFGFGKTVAHNYELLNGLEAFTLLACPILVGFSRKSMIYKPLGITADEALTGTTVLNALSLQKGADILRVHDVREAKQVVEMMALVKQNQKK